MNEIKLNKGDSAIIIRHLDKGFDVEIYHSHDKNNITLNRKVLADLAMNNPNAFEAIVKSLK